MSWPLRMAGMTSIPVIIQHVADLSQICDEDDLNYHSWLPKQPMSRTVLLGFGATSRCSGVDPCEWQASIQCPLLYTGPLKRLCELICIDAISKEGVEGSTG